MAEFGRPTSVTDFSERDWRQYMARCGWPAERIDAAFVQLGDDEVIVAAGADSILIQKDGPRAEERRFHIYEQTEPEVCPTCGKEL